MLFLPVISVQDVQPKQRELIEALVWIISPKTFEFRQQKRPGIFYLTLGKQKTSIGLCVGTADALIIRINESQS